VELSLDAEGRIDLDRFERTVRGGLDLVTFPHVSSHRGIVQPAGQVTSVCHRLGVPTIVDVTQSAGCIDLRDVHATAFFGTSRKWLRGPRGVGFVAIAGDSPLTESGRLETHESSDAARVGFARALVELEEEGIHNVSARIAWMASRVRRTLQTLAGCAVLEPLDEPSGIVTFRCEGMGASDVRTKLLAQGILVSAIPVERAPLEPGFRPLVRVAAHAYSNDSDLERLVDALRSIEKSPVL
jgi:pyridoxal 5-phosphate dependent beta-lyase